MWTQMDEDQMNGTRCSPEDGMEFEANSSAIDYITQYQCHTYCQAMYGIQCLVPVLLARFRPGTAAVDGMLPLLLKPPALSRLATWYARSSSVSTAHLIFKAATAGQTLRSPFNIQYSSVSLVGVSSNLTKSPAATSGTSIMLGPGTVSSTRNRRMLMGSAPRVSICFNLCLISRPTILIKNAVMDAILLRVSINDGPCMSDCRNGMRYGRAWLTMKWFTLNNSAIRRRGESLSL